MEMKFTKIVYKVSLLIFGLGIVVNGYSQSFLTNGLVAYYQFNGSALDASGNGNNGTVYGATLTTDRFGQRSEAYSFNGSSWIDIGSVVSRYDLLTLSAWVYSTDSSAGPYSHAIVTKPRFAPSGAGLRLDLYDGKLETGFNNSAVNLVVSDTNSAIDGRWHHAVAVANVTNVLLYVDGHFSGSAPFPSNPVTSAASMFIGKESEGGELRFFTGLIDDVRIYTRALSPAEVQQLYVIETTPPLGFETNGLVAFYPFNGNANDASGNGNDGMNYGGTFVSDRFGISNAAICFDGGYASTDFFPPLGGASRTISGWFNAATTGRLMTPLAYGGDANDTGGRLEVCIDPSGHFVMDFSNNTVSTLNRYGNSQWHNFVMVVPTDATTTNIAVYLDGVLQTGFTYVFIGGPPVWVNTLPKHPLIFGMAYVSGGSRYYSGDLDDIRIYDRALMDSEVQQLYLLEAPPLLNVKKAVYLDCPNLKVGTNYQLQVSSDLTDWTNYGTPFTATNSSWRTTDYWDVDNWNSLYFRLQVAP